MKQVPRTCHGWQFLTTLGHYLSNCIFKFDSLPLPLFLCHLGQFLVYTLFLTSSLPCEMLWDDLNARGPHSLLHCLPITVTRWTDWLEFAFTHGIQLCSPKCKMGKQEKHASSAVINSLLKNQKTVYVMLRTLCTIPNGIRDLFRQFF
jgi:hypothetical protein